MPPVPKPRSEKSGRNRNLIIALAVAAVVALALILGSILLTRDNSDETATATETVSTTGTSTERSTPAPVALVAGIPQKGTILGNPAATVRMLQFEDLQCPICKQYMDNAFSAIVNEYVRPGRVKIDFRGLAFIGPDSLKALKIAVAAGFQNKLWQVVGLFYENQGAENSGWVTDSLINEILAEVPGLDAAKVKADAKGAAVANEITAFQKEATELQVKGTPSFFFAVGVNKPVPFEPQAYEPSEFRPALDAALRG